MANIAGQLFVSDEYMHEVGDEPNFNESMYFNFHDPAAGIGGFLRVGNRPNEGIAETTATIFLPGGRVLFDFRRPRIAGNAAFDAGGIRFDVLEPADRLRTRYRGAPVALAEPREMRDPKRAFTTNPRSEVHLDLVHEAVGPMYGSRHDEREAAESHDRQFAKSHYEQHMRVEGSLVVDGAKTEITGYGLRDHSWGPRYWQAIDSYEWLTMNFGADLGAMVSIVRKPGAEPRTGGVVVEGAAIDPIVAASIQIEYEAGTPYHRAIEVEAETRSRKRYAVTGRVLSFIPLRNRRDGRVTQVGEGLTEWRVQGRIGYGLSELLRTLTPEDRRAPS